MRPLGPALEARRELGGQGGWGDVVYRLTAFGESLLRQGMNGPEEMPPLRVGGHDCASPNGIWVRATRGRSWRLAPGAGRAGSNRPVQTGERARLAAACTPIPARRSPTVGPPEGGRP